MAKDKRLFARLDLDYADHPKIGGLSDAAFRAHVEMILYSRKYMTDGVIPKRVASRFATESLSELLANDSESPSLIALGGGEYLLHGYADMNETRAEVEHRTRVNIENGRRGGLAKKRNAKQTATESLSERGSEKASENVAETETETETEVSSKELTTRARESFESVWSSWPKKTEKKKSLEQFEKAAKRIGVDVLSDHVRNFGRAYAASTETQFVPALAVWLRNERWTDELPARQDPDAWMNRSQGPRAAWMESTRADEANSFIQRLEAIDATRGSGEVVGDRPQLR